MFLQITAEATTNLEIALVLKKYYAVLTKRIETLICSAIDRGEIDGSIQPHEAAVFMIACVDGLIARMACDPDLDSRASSRLFQTWICTAFDLKIKGPMKKPAAKTKEARGR